MRTIFMPANLVDLAVPYGVLLPPGLVITAYVEDPANVGLIDSRLPTCGYISSGLRQVPAPGANSYLLTQHAR